MSAAPCRRLLAVALILHLAACGAAGPAAEPSPRPAAAAPAAATANPGAGAATAAGATVPALVPDAEPEPPLATTGTDFDAVWRSIAARHAWLYRHPDPAGLDALYLPRCLCYEESRAQLAAYADQGRWWTGARPAVTAVEVRDASAPDLVTLRVTSVREGESQLVDATGAVHETAPARGPFHTNVVLARDSARAPWLVLDLADQGPVPGAPQ